MLQEAGRRPVACCDAEILGEVGVIGVWGVWSGVKVVLEEIGVLCEGQGSRVPTAHADRIGGGEGIYRVGGAMTGGGKSLQIGGTAAEIAEFYVGGSGGRMVRNAGAVGARVVVLFEVGGDWEGSG